MHDTYESPLNTRYASREMTEIFSDNSRIKLWRKLWIALAESEMELGLPITKEQIEQMKQCAESINWDFAKQKENELRHDVMAHIHAFGEQADKAMPIIHLGATSCFVTDNAELIIIHNALRLVRSKIVTLLSKLNVFARKYKSLACLGFTHLQPAQLTTVGKRATLWMQDLLLDLEQLDFILSNFRLRGVKGTTGTQASFFSLFDDDQEKVRKLETLVCSKLGFDKIFQVTGQTYTRKFDYTILSLVSMIGQSAYKFAGDLRILQSMKEVEEPFEKTQVGSSAMAYKRNPMRSERICALARYCLSLPQNASMTAATQMFERTLDDSANKRIVIAQAFLALDGVLDLYINVAENMVVYEKTIKKHIDAELPFMATEAILMECVRLGGDRQQLHEAIRTHSMESARMVKLEGKENDLIDRLRLDPMFSKIKASLDSILDASKFIGRAAEQTDEFLNEQIAPLLKKNADQIIEPTKIKV